MPVEKDRKFELRRAWFGMPFSLFELGRLDEAEKYLEKCLEVAPGDAKILGEPDYVRKQRAKKTG